MSTSAKVIADSINVRGDRITTFEVCFWRPVLAEWNTHRLFSRNSASSRAIPVTKQLERLRKDPAFPLSWPAEQRGMQGGDKLAGHDDLTNQDTPYADATLLWSNIYDEVHTRIGRYLEDHEDAGDRLHKSVLNRLMEPFMWHTAVITATAFGNFFDQRCSPLAQPEIRAVAELMQQAYIESEPEHLGPGEWHLPYVDNEDREWVAYKDPNRKIGGSAFPALVRVSAARCAQLSYLTQPEVVDGVVVDPGGKRDITKDLARYEKLTTASPKHWSPLEHVATPMPHNRQEGVIHLPSVEGKKYNVVNLSHRPKHGNLLGWASLRSIVEAELGEETYR